jgi:hypothetical protein
MSESLVNATQLVDKAIQKIAGQSLVSSAEMTDLLLDIRLCLMSCETSVELV